MELSTPRNIMTFSAGDSVTDQVLLASVATLKSVDEKRSNGIRQKLDTVKSLLEVFQQKDSHKAINAHGQNYSEIFFKQKKASCIE